MSGRPFKESLDYSKWAVDIFDNEIKIDKLMEAQGCVGFTIYFYLCQRAYGSNGYYYLWSFDETATTARKIGGGASSGNVEQTVKLCFQIGLFDKNLFDGYGILTSRGIQKQHRDVALTRTNKTVISEYWLLNEKESAGLSFCALNLNSNPLESNYTPPKLNYAPPKSNFSGSRVKYSKVEYRRGRVKYSKVTPPANGVRADEPSPTVIETDKARLPITLTTPKEKVIFPEDKIAELGKMFPDVDIVKDIEKMQKAIDSMPKCNLYGKSLSEYITRWFNRTQMSGGNKKSNGSPANNGSLLNVDEFFKKAVKKSLKL